MEAFIYGIGSHHLKLVTSVAFFIQAQQSVNGFNGHESLVNVDGFNDILDGGDNDFPTGSLDYIVVITLPAENLGNFTQ